MKLKRTNLVSHITNLTRLMVFLSMIGFLLGAAFLTQEAIDNVKLSTAINSTYQHIMFTLDKENILQREYILHPNTVLRSEHLETVTVLSGQMQTLQRQIRPVDASLVQQLLALQTHYMSTSNQFFAAIDTMNSVRANMLTDQDINPTFNRLENVLYQLTEGEATRSTYALAQLTIIQQTLVITGLVLFVIGICLLSITVYVAKVYRKKIDEATQAELARLAYLALTDTLTNLGNHHAYQEQLACAWEEAHQRQEALTLAALDIDDFKLLNDEQGHQRGDEVLLGVAEVLRDICASCALFRLSADDFVMLLPRVSLPEASATLERVRNAIQQRFPGVTVSIGVTHVDSEDLTLEVFQAQSKQALQEAKRQGRNRVLTFETIACDASFVPLAKRQAVRRLLNDGLLTIAFQPIWDLATGTVAAFEALTRPAAGSGFAGPQELFDVAEQMGRAHELDAVCVQAILARAAELPPNVLLFLNLTPQSLSHDLLTGTILREMVSKAGLEPSRVVLEITERSIVKLEEVVQKARYLQMLGFRIALDDAGAGNAGLEMLSQLSVDFIKIDRAVVANALTNPVVRSVFAGISTIARESHIAVVAEGIETIEVLDFVQQAGAQYAQGYLLGRPAAVISEVKTLQDVLPLLSTS
jgi:diguanylate cyclase (GGDEF)-like protein